MHVIEGSQVVILCESEGYPKPDYIWYQDTKRITDLKNSEDENKFTVDQKSGKLIIHDIKIPKNNKDDKYKFVCNVKNTYGTATASAFVAVQNATKVLSKAKSEKFVSMQTYIFPCEFKVSKKSSYT